MFYAKSSLGSSLQTPFPPCQINPAFSGRRKACVQVEAKHQNVVSDKLVITDTALASASNYINFYATKTAIAPDQEIAFILSQTQYKDLKAKKN